MPSGAKKRKAAKKKKENQSKNESIPSFASTHSHGNEDVKQAEEKEGDIDIGNVSSNISEDHLEKEEVIQKETRVPDISSKEGSRIDTSENFIAVEEGVVQVERNFKIEDGSDEKIEHVEREETSYNEGSCWSSSCRSSNTSSDDENHGIKNTQVEGDIALAVDPLSGKSAAELERNLVLTNQVEVKTVVQENGEEEEITHSVENVSKEHVGQENDHRLSAPQNATTADDRTTNEPSVVPSQKTSWKSCCGLLDLFSGSRAQ